MNQEAIVVSVDNQMAEVKLVTPSGLLGLDLDAESKLPPVPCIPLCNPACIPGMLPNPCVPQLVKECLPKLIPPKPPKPS